jgi:hypothetical protein
MKAAQVLDVLGHLLLGMQQQSVAGDHDQPTFDRLNVLSIHCFSSMTSGLAAPSQLRPKRKTSRRLELSGSMCSIRTAASGQSAAAMSSAMTLRLCSQLVTSDGLGRLRT